MRVPERLWLRWADRCALKAGDTISCKQCGWYWHMRWQRPHWWSRSRLMLWGPFWPEGGGAPRMYTLDDVRDQYPDCWRHLGTSFQDLFRST